VSRVLLSCTKRRSKRNGTDPDFEERWRRGCCWHRHERRRHLAWYLGKRFDCGIR
jgi:hypothetical protein